MTFDAANNATGARGMNLFTFMSTPDAWTRYGVEALYPAHRPDAYFDEANRMYRAWKTMFGSSTALDDFSRLLTDAPDMDSETVEELTTHAARLTEIAEHQRANAITLALIGLSIQSVIDQLDTIRAEHTAAHGDAPFDDETCERLVRAAYIGWMSRKAFLVCLNSGDFPGVPHFAATTDRLDDELADLVREAHRVVTSQGRN